MLWVFGFSIVCSSEGDLTKNETQKPTIKAIKKASKVVCQPFSVKEYLVSIGDKKYPNEPIAVTILIAIVLLDNGKCFPTTDIGILIAVPPRPIPTKIPRSNWKKIPVLGPAYKK